MSNNRKSTHKRENIEVPLPPLESFECIPIQCEWDGWTDDEWVELDLDDINNVCNIYTTIGNCIHNNDINAAYQLKEFIHSGESIDNTQCISKIAENEYYNAATAFIITTPEQLNDNTRDLSVAINDITKVNVLPTDNDDWIEYMRQSRSLYNICCSVQRPKILPPADVHMPTDWFSAHGSPCRKQQNTLQEEEEEEENNRNIFKRLPLINEDLKSHIEQAGFYIRCSEKNIQGIEKNIQGISQGIEQDIQGIEQDIQGIEQDIRMAIYRMEQANVYMQYIDMPIQYIDALIRYIATLKERIATLKERIATLKERIAE